MSKRIKDFCKCVSNLVKNGDITRQQGKTLTGQAKHGDIEAAFKGLMTITGRW